MEKKFEYTVVSGYSCLEKLSPKTKRIHLRKFISKKLVKNILDSCINLKEISLPKHISEKINGDITEMLKERNIEVNVSENLPGRPNLLDNMIKWKGLKSIYKLDGKKIAA